MFTSLVLLIKISILLSSCASFSPPVLSAPQQTPEQELSGLLNWRFTPDMVPQFTETAEEGNFKKELQGILQTEGFKFCYSVNVPNYFILHVLPYFFVAPGPLCGIRGYVPFRNAETPASMANILEKRGYSRKIFQPLSSFDILKEFSEQSKRNVVVLTLSPGYSSNPQTIFYVSHGIDEDIAYMQNMTLTNKPPRYQTTSLLFTRFVESNLDVPVAKVKEYYKLDPLKKTIFYAATYGAWEFIDVGVAPEQTWKKTLKDLIELKKDYNIIYRPHPQSSEATLNAIKDHFIIAPSSMFPSFGPIYQVSDLLIGTVSSATTGITSRPEVPIVLLRPTKSWSWGLGTGGAFENEIYPMDEIAKRNKGRVLGEDTAVVQNEINVDLKAAVKNAFATNTKDRIDARKRYFAYWFGCIDGYEQYREMINFLEHQVVDVSKLKEIYRTFPIYKGRKNCLSDQ